MCILTNFGTKYAKFVQHTLQIGEGQSCLFVCFFSFLSLNFKFLIKVTNVSLRPHYFGFFDQNDKIVYKIQISQISL